MERRIAFAVGALLATVALLSWRIPAEGAGLGADARFVALPPGELMVEPVDRFLSARALHPGGSAAVGELRVRNITGRAVRMRLRALPSSRELDRLLRVRIEGCFRGRLGELRRWTRPLELPRGGERALAVRVWLPRAGTGQVDGAGVDVTVELSAGRRRG